MKPVSQTFRKARISMFLLLITLSGLYAQNPTYLCELRNDHQADDRTYEFDVYLLRTGSTVFEFTSMQFGININPGVLNGGILSVNLVSGSSELNASQIPTAGKFVFSSSTNCIIMTGMAPPGAGSGTIISDIGNGTRLGRIRLTNTASFGTVKPNLTWSFSIANGYHTKLNAYVGGIATEITVQDSHTTSNLNNSTLNPILVQDVSLTTGWNIMSFAGEPDNMSLMSIVTPLKNAGTLVKIQDEKGNAIEQLPAPIGWVDNIGLMKVSEGYKIKVSANTTLSGVTGAPVTLPYTIALETGWNIMGYPSMDSQTAIAAFQSLIDAGTLLKVQDEKGNAIEKLPAPIGWVDNIHTLAQGEGYKIKVSEATSITINNSGK